MAIFTIQTTIRTDKGLEIWFPFEHPAETVDDLRHLLVKEGSIVGDRLQTEFRRSRGEGLVLKGRKRVAIFEAGIATIQDFGQEIWDPEFGGYINGDEPV